METDADVFIVAHDITIDLDIYDLWLQGYSTKEITDKLLIQEADIHEWGEDADELLSLFISHQIAFFEILQRRIENDSSQNMYRWALPINSQLLGNLVEKYYQFDDSVMRELLGKKLAAKTRKDLDDISEKTKVRLKSCRRQFDNFKRIFRVVEDQKGSLVSNIQKQFMLSELLAGKYGACVFITNNRFETNKKKLCYMSFDDFVFCAYQMITCWSLSSTESKQEDQDQDLDREFLQNLKYFKMVLEKEAIDELKHSTSEKLHGRIAKLTKADLENSYKNLLRVLINIAIDLNRSRDLRDLFVDIVEKVIDPCKRAKWTVDDLANFLSETSSVIRNHEIIADHVPPLVKTWDRFMNVMTACIIRMYHD